MDLSSVEKTPNPSLKSIKVYAGYHSDSLTEVTLNLLEDVHMVDGLGGEIWDGAVFLSRYLEKIQCHNLTIIELGTGTGMCGLVASILGASEVVLTDEFIDLAEENTRLFCENFPGKKVNCQVLTWGDDSPLLEQPFDLILGSELTPMKSTHEALVQTLSCLLLKGGQGEMTIDKQPYALFTLDICQEDMEVTCNSVRCAAHNFLQVLNQFGLQWEIVEQMNSRDINQHTLFEHEKKGGKPSKNKGERNGIWFEHNTSKMSSEEETQSTNPEPKRQDNLILELSPIAIVKITPQDIIDNDMVGKVV